MKAIDRAAYWVQTLERVGFDIECETSVDIVRNEYLTVRATKGNAKVVFMILMNTPRTRFVTGAAGYVRVGKFTRKPSQMAGWIAREYDLETLRMQQAVAS